jgi:hypothetical protein
MPDFLETWKQLLNQDLSRFADRGSETKFESDGNTLGVSWQVRGKPHDAIFSLQQGGRLRWASGPTSDAPYFAFLASEGMADLPQLASACLATMEREPDFVASDAIVDNGVESVRATLTPRALTDLSDGAREQADGSTQVFFLKGDAGAGKTTLLREATILQAERYLAGDSAFLFLYVPAQGRELSNLRDAFAGELDELRAAFTRDAIASLAREGVLVPVIDGFDELLGTAGYSGAFSSLQTFLGELEGYGTLVVSARSAFYDIEFLGRSGGRRNEAAMSITTVQMLPWSDEQLDDYLVRDREGRDPALTAAARDRLTPADRELLRTPFFASQFEGFSKKTTGRDNSEGLLEHLINAYIDREADKIVNADGGPVLPPEGHHRLFELAVTEMWESESRQLSANDLRTIAELVAEEFDLNADQAGQLGAKVTSYAGFRARRGSHASRASFAFEHEVYFDHFLSRALQRLIAEARFDELVTFFDRRIVPEGVAAMSIHALRDDKELDASLLRCSTGVSFENRRRNLGSLLLAYARDVRPLTDATVQGLSFIDVASGAARLSKVQFERCQFIDVDLRGVEFVDCDAATSIFDGVTLNAKSHLAVSGLIPGANLRRVHHETLGDLYAPGAITDVITALGAPVVTPSVDKTPFSAHATDLIELLHRVARAYSRTMILYDDSRHHSLFGSPHWDELKPLLIRHGVISEEMREAKGANVLAYRLRANLDELLAAEEARESPHSSTSGLWADIRALP